VLNMVVALATESRPLIEHFGLSEDRSAVGFRVFANDRMRLVVTGMGRVSCAAGVAAVGERHAGTAAWLNVGTAGHPELALGAGVHALKVCERATGRCWYPTQVVPLPGTGGTVCTVDEPVTDYPGACSYDMEASAFFATAMRYATSELTQVYKIITDNREHGAHTVDKHRIRHAFRDHLEPIARMAAGLGALAGSVAATRPRLDELERIAQRWYFTVAQKNELRELLRRWEALAGTEPLMDADLNRCPSTKSVLAEIGARIERRATESGGGGP